MKRVFYGGPMSANWVPRQLRWTDFLREPEPPVQKTADCPNQRGWDSKHAGKLAPGKKRNMPIAGCPSPGVVIHTP